MSVSITTGSNCTTHYGEITFTEALSPSLDERCLDASHEHAPIYCMWHGMTYGEHEVGSMCLDCDKQWFFAHDWSTPECRDEREFERSSRLRLFVARLDRLIAGWEWRNAWHYKP